MATREGPAIVENSQSRDGYQVAPFSRFQHQAVDWLGLMHRKHTAHLLLEVDVTQAREVLRAHQASTGEDVSLAAFVTVCVARAVDENKHMHAYRKGRSRLMLFDDVDIALLLGQQIESDNTQPWYRSLARTPHIVRSANKKSPGRIEQEIQATLTERSAITVWLPFWLLLPAPVRTLIWKSLLANPRLRKRITGTVALSSVDIVGSRTGELEVEATGARWSIPLVAYTLSLDLGGIARKPSVAPVTPPAVAGGQDGPAQVELRDYLCLTISTDDDVIDGARAVRFAGRLKELIEGDGSIALLARDEPTARAPEAEEVRHAADSAARAAAAVTAIKSIHTAIFFGMASCVGYIVYSGLVGRISGLTKLAMITLTSEGVIYSRNGFRCPLADMAEDLGAESGTVGDIFLPGWFEKRIPVFSSALLLIAGAAYWLRRVQLPAR